MRLCISVLVFFNILSTFVVNKRLYNIYIWLHGSSGPYLGQVRGSRSQIKSQCRGRKLLLKWSVRPRVRAVLVLQRYIISKRLTKQSAASLARAILIDPLENRHPPRWHERCGYKSVPPVRRDVRSLVRHSLPPQSAVVVRAVDPFVAHLRRQSVVYPRPG